MSNSFSFLFHFLEKENISIDKTEFEFQIQSHPDYPSLLSIADTLSFFNIDNGVIPVAISNLKFLPDCFVTLLKEEKSDAKLYLLRKRALPISVFMTKKL